MKKLYQSILMVVIILTLLACGQKFEDNAELKERAKTHAIKFMEDLSGRDFQVEGYKFSGIEGAVLFG